MSDDDSISSDGGPDPALSDDSDYVPPGDKDPNISHTLNLDSPSCSSDSPSPLPDFSHVLEPEPLKEPEKVYCKVGEVL